MNDSGWNMYVFRDGRKNVHGTQLKGELRGRLSQFTENRSEDTAIGALIAAGELECALADAGAGCQETSKITDVIAAAVVSGGLLNSAGAFARLDSIALPEKVSISVAEGFAYYALHPLRFRDPVRQLANSLPVRIIGVRSIGTTLSAIVRALFEQHGTKAERITVRPHGHPYDRKLELTVQEKNWLRECRDALVVIVDEGPGLSGSSFLSVAEAVESAGIPANRIVMLGSRYPDPNQMRAPNAAIRWPRFRFLAADPAPLLPPDANLDLTGGMWRHYFWEDFENQPAAWPQLESAKYMTSDRQTLYKFHGFGHFGDDIAQRGRLAADAGFAPAWTGMARGFGSYALLHGRPLSQADLSSALLQRAADYCAFRTRELQVSPDAPSDLEQMAKWNWQCEFGYELRELHLPVERLVIADGRMLPHEWLLTDEGRILKLDGSTHGDDHFFPGPCDIAWDLAGMVVEWDMSESQTSALLDAYREKSGDDVRSRIGDYVLGYAIFRMGWSKMAAQASAACFDEKLLLRDYLRYRKITTDAAKARGVKESIREPRRTTTTNLKPAVVI